MAACELLLLRLGRRDACAVAPCCEPDLDQPALKLEAPSGIAPAGLHCIRAPEVKGRTQGKVTLVVEWGAVSIATHDKNRSP